MSDETLTIVWPRGAWEAWAAEKTKRQGSVVASSTGHSCGCVGPQNGQPKCPCMMRGVIERDGRWIEPERDLGPVRPATNPKG